MNTDICNPLVNIVTIVKNERNFIDNFLRSVCNQEYTHFQSIIVDNASSDGTTEQIENFQDNRIKHILAPENMGLGELRNLGLAHCNGVYIFFTDADCEPSRFWITAGIRLLQKTNYLGVEGRTFYHYRKNLTISDYNTETLESGNFMTCNIAYKREILNKLGGFDPNFNFGHEDRELALRVLDIGPIAYSPDMLVCHQTKLLTARAIFNRTKRARNMVALIKKHPKQYRWYQRILYPQHLVILIFPILLITHYSYRKPKDVLIGLTKYVALFFERLIIWQTAIKTRTFVL